MRKARTIRLEKGLSLTDVVRGTKLSLGHLALFERGLAGMSIEKIQELAGFYKCSIDDLLAEAASVNGGTHAA